MRFAYFVSDQTGITIEKLGTALLGKFPSIDFQHETIPFMDTAAKITQLLTKTILPKYELTCHHNTSQQAITLAASQENAQAEIANPTKIIIISSIINPTLRNLLSVEYAVHLDFFAAFIPQLEQEFRLPAMLEQLKIHGIGNEEKYNHRIEAIHFALENDDGISAKHYDIADIILIGVSRSAKTPTSIYLAVNFSLKAANYPLIPEDLAHDCLPAVLQSYRHKLFGLSIDADKLHTIREHRLANSQYAALVNCQAEITAAENIMQQQQIPYINTSKRSIEEIAVAIMQHLKRK